MLVNTNPKALLGSLLLLLLLPLVSSAPQSNCTSCAPNPLASIYPNNATGTINSTTAVLLVPIAHARALLPAHLAPLLLPHAWTRFSIPPNQYPLVVETGIDHDIRFQGINAVADFSSLHFTFPFIGLLGDNATCFRYTSYIYLPATVPLAVSGAQAYGENVLPATFDPADAAYRRTSSGSISQKIYSGQNSQALGQPPAARTLFAPALSKRDQFSPAFYRNVTNQPIFGNDTTVCDNMIRFWNTSVSQGEYEPQDLYGEVELGPPLVGGRDRVWRGVKAVGVTTAFLENNYVPCVGLRGYKGTGSGDSG
ncbi:MAG: hypothetical protein HETSPECPRED_003844 [Heterodermia speciosa]|uniref:Uncharacterized protein n=1 Tax=Heterodermia speciosa TaxID=116794 RepID=A0A8H3J6H1_9LECA|nr:MAG: hypothetical protein HETSPECPRED_003844 [Heterodermia speciosa]